MLKYNLPLLTQTTDQNPVKLLQMITDALKIVERVNKSNFEKLLYGGFQEQAGASKALRQDIILLESLH